MAEHFPLATLTEEGCRVRERGVADALKAAGFDAALLTCQRQIHALTGFWNRSAFRSLLLLTSDGNTFFAVPRECEAHPFVTAAIPYAILQKGTLIDDPMAAGVEALAEPLRGLKQIGTDGRLPPLPDKKTAMEDIVPLLVKTRRTKLADEIAIIERGVRACEAGYAKAREIIRPGLTEWSLYLQVLSAATETVGEPIADFGNDFQSGTIGGPPRGLREMPAGELVPLDLSVVVRGYASDLCRTFAVDQQPTAAQRDAHRQVCQALAYVEKTVRPGVSCLQLYRDVFAQLDGYKGWSFPHHLGHGIGLSPQEAPRLNPFWDDVFQEGDVFTAEPGLYSPELRGGLRLERDYVVTATGVRPLCRFPLDF